VSQGLQRNLNIQPDRPVGDVVDVEIHALFQKLGVADFSAEAAHLRESRDPGLHQLAGAVGARDQGKLGIVRREVRPRSHDAHLAHEHIPKLREFIETRLLQRRTKWITDLP
jgi:hypothetical protein